MLSLQPRSAAARKMIPELRVDFDAAKLQLIATELQFTDGSRMRNEFSNQVLNPAIEPERFRPQIGPDFKIVNPLKR
jgi:outer membrane lipoprotein-sorting protein